jgi:hypothetical protein
VQESTGNLACFDMIIPGLDKDEAAMGRLKAVNIYIHDFWALWIFWAYWLVREEIGQVWRYDHVSSPSGLSVIDGRVVNAKIHRWEDSIRTGRLRLQYRGAGGWHCSPDYSILLDWGHSSL